jgi:hypothetical protein
MLGFIKNLFKKPSESVLGIDIGPSSIKVVQLSRKKGRAVLDTYGALALGPYAGIEIGRSTNLPPEKIAEALVDVLRESGTTTKQCGLSIPMSSSLLTLIEVPATNEAQLDQIIPIEARKYIPLPISEVALDWWVVPQEQVGISTEFDSGQKAPGGPAAIPKITVLLVVIHNEALARAQEIIRLPIFPVPITPSFLPYKSIPRIACGSRQIFSFTVFADSGTFRASERSSANAYSATVCSP